MSQKTTQETREKLREAVERLLMNRAVDAMVRHGPGHVRMNVSRVRRERGRGHARGVARYTLRLLVSGYRPDTYELSLLPPGDRPRAEDGLRVAHALSSGNPLLKEAVRELEAHLLEHRDLERGLRAHEGSDRYARSRAERERRGFVRSLLRMPAPLREHLTGAA